jgi:AsmA protein
MTLRSSLKWIAGLALALIALPVLFVAIFGWNWLRGPIERLALEKTGRELTIGGDLDVDFGWPHPRIHAGAVTFANPSWATEKQMLAAEAFEVSIDLPQFVQQRIVLPEVRLRRPVIFLEQGTDGRRNWLLDLAQQDEGARIEVGRLMLDEGALGYDDAAQKTRIRAELSTSNAQPVEAGLTFTAQGQFKGLPLQASGSGGPVLGLRDERTPYPLQGALSVGGTAVKGEGTITSLMKFSAVDMHLAVNGRNLAQLYPLLGIAFPETGAYSIDGHIVRSGHKWRYEKFSGRFGSSDIAGTVEIDTGGKRPAMKADLASDVLDIADLGPLIGARPGRLTTARAAAPPPSDTAAPNPARARVLPEMPFKTERWDSVDAEVTLKARTIRRAGELPLEDLVTHLSLRDSVLRLDPLDFGIAGGQLDAVISMDGRKDPIRVRAKAEVSKILIAQLFPAVELVKTGTGQIDGKFDLSGSGNSVRRMLASASGTLGVVATDGEVSRLLMEKAGLHLWEILELQVTGDELVKLHCAVAHFDVKEGVMQSRALIFDTEITTIIGTGQIDLRQEKLGLTLTQRTKDTSPVALRSPIRLRGTFARPDVSVDKGRVATRALGAIALGMINPLLGLIPLIDAGPGQDSNCAQLVRDARALSQSASKTMPP